MNIMGTRPYLIDGALTVDCRPRGWAFFSFDVALDQIPYTFEFAWNTRDQRWYVSIVDLVERVKVVPFYPIFQRAINNRIQTAPPGFLYFANLAPTERPPNFRELGTRTILVYVPEAILPRTEIQEIITGGQLAGGA